jgi:hypothetical protein
MSLAAKRFIACHVDEWEWSSWEPPFVHFLLTAVERGAVLHMSITSGNGIPSPVAGAGLTGALIILRMERGCLHPCSLGCASPNG